jgi:hypothetical protein
VETARLHAGIGLGEGAGREPGRARATAVLHAASSIQTTRPFADEVSRATTLRGQMMYEPSMAADVSGRFDHVLVDEYQDTNRLQASILLMLKPDGRGLSVVGDDAQSIYSFGAATVRNIGRRALPGATMPRSGRRLRDPSNCGVLTTGSCTIVSRIRLRSCLSSVRCGRA